MHLKLWKKNQRCSDTVNSIKTSVNDTSKWKCSTCFLRPWTVADPADPWSIGYAFFNDGHNLILF